MLHSVTRLILLLFVLTALAGIVPAQATNGRIFGSVTDPNDAVLPKAVVFIKHLATNVERKLNASSDGTYTADNLQPGDYEVRVEVAGFQKQLKRLTLQTGANVEENFEMTVGASSETVVITSESAQLNTSDYKVDGVITRERIENLPLNGRSFLSLAALEPGVDVSFVANPGAGGPNSYFRVSIAGSTNTLTRISVDGANVNDRITGGTAQNFSQGDGAGISDLDLQLRPLGRQYLFRCGQHRLAHRRERLSRQRILLLPRSQYGGFSRFQASQRPVRFQSGIQQPGSARAAGRSILCQAQYRRQYRRTDQKGQAFLLRQL
ncbi:MAG: carboxypeptidase regulatory-like domain-containing protein [Acidobacteria bacterium]|nr:carboxypeptidase regulatory-like domain-containing protein [Acidobacteriota bacterium]